MDLLATCPNDHTFHRWVRRTIRYDSTQLNQPRLTLTGATADAAAASPAFRADFTEAAKSSCSAAASSNACCWEWARRVRTRAFSDSDVSESSVRAHHPSRSARHFSKMPRVLLQYSLAYVRCRRYSEESGKRKRSRDYSVAPCAYDVEASCSRGRRLEQQICYRSMAETLVRQTSVARTTCTEHSEPRALKVPFDRL